MTSADATTKSTESVESKSPRPRYLVGAVAALLGFLAIIVLVAGALSGWFNGGSAPTTVTLSAEYIADDSATDPIITVDSDEFDKLIADGKSFIVLSHLPGCTANILQYLNQYSTERHIRYVYFPWSLFRETTFHDQIQYAPTVALFGEGELVTFLAADSDADTDKYNSSEAFAAWLDQYLK